MVYFQVLLDYGESTLFTSHYFAITKSADNNWYIFNDQTVKKIPQDKIVTKCAYVLIYQQYDK